MASEAEDATRKSGTFESDVSEQEVALSRLRGDFDELSERAQQLLTEKLFLENEYAQLKKRANRLDEELRNIKSPPLVIGYIQDLIDDQAVVRSSNGTVFLVSVNKRLEFNDLKPGTRVALNQDTLSVIDILSDSWDPLVSGTEVIDSTSVEYSSIGGLDTQIQELREAIELPFENPEVFKEFGIDPPKGVLLTGPPGTGKTMLAKAVANATKATFLGLVGAELAQKYIGEGGRMVRELFDLAREKAPSIIFIDELDSIGSKRLDTATSGDREVQRTLMQLLSEMDGFESLNNVKVIAATNRPELLDVALLRPGRFDRIIEIPMPDVNARTTIFQVHSKSMPLFEDVKLRKLAIMADGFSGAEIKSTAIEAGISAISDGRDSVTKSDFVSAIKKIERKRREGSSMGPDGLYG
ncbi:MAG: proteasome-activating nucleotidase [Candidatus Thermoplasmatota archaeon]|nr:proteasome-activating nucleotidase [Candidatus Thermoplasmatota archaeon]